MDRTVSSCSGSKLQESNPKNKTPIWKKLYRESQTKDSHLKSIDDEIELYTSRLAALQITRHDAFGEKRKQLAEPSEDKLSTVFTPLSEEEEEEVNEALKVGNREEVLAFHESSGIEITRMDMQCLRPGRWLNDEVINLYMELLKERELRDPEKFLKCHFFNTFFYNKLYKDKQSYDFKAVQRWTTQKRIGYALHECDKVEEIVPPMLPLSCQSHKIFVPIHKGTHWCLGIINIREKQLEYLDSLNGRDKNVLPILARYLMDEANHKSGKCIDVNSWERDFPEDIPEQLNGCDCGMFMVKYVDFHSHGLPLAFSQEEDGSRVVAFEGSIMVIVYLKLISKIKLKIDMRYLAQHVCIKAEILPPNAVTNNSLL